MNKNTALMVAGIIFAVVALAHALRLFYAVEIIAAGYMIPMWVSWVGFVVAFILCGLMFMARRNRS